MQTCVFNLHSRNIKSCEFARITDAKNKRNRFSARSAIGVELYSKKSLGIRTRDSNWNLIAPFRQIHLKALAEIEEKVDREEVSDGIVKRQNGSAGGRYSRKSGYGREPDEVRK